MPQALEAAILHSLQRDPDDRPRSADALRTELLAVGGAVGVAPTLRPWPPGTRPSSNPPRVGRDSRDGAAAPDHPPAAAGAAPAEHPPVGRPAPAAAAPPPRNWTAPALLIGLVLVALAVAGILLGSVVGDEVFGPDQPELPGVGGGGDGGGGAALTLRATAFDPEGDGAEGDDQAPLAVDGDLETSWTSETYDSREDFQGLKPGVGLILTLEQASALGDLVVDAGADFTGWSAEVYVADAPAVDLGGWGSPVATQEAVEGTATFDLSGLNAGAILLWITDLGSGAPEAVVDEVGLAPG